MHIAPACDCGLAGIITATGQPVPIVSAGSLNIIRLRMLAIARRPERASVASSNSSSSQIVSPPSMPVE